MKFIPKEKQKKKHVTIDLPINQYFVLTKKAKESNISIKEYCRQAIAYIIGEKHK